MLMTLELANTIVKRAMSIIHHNVNVIDHRGIIIASGEPHLIGERHEVACEVIKTRQRIVINTLEQSAKFSHVQLGINHPIIVDDNVVFVIGICGNPAAINRFAELAILTAELLTQQARDIREINWQYRIRDLLIKQLLEVSDKQKSQQICHQLRQHNIDLEHAIIPVLIHMETGGNLLNKTVGDLLNKVSDIAQSQQVVLLNSDDILLLVSAEQDLNVLTEQLNQFFRTQLSHYVICIGMVSHSAALFCRSIFVIKEMLKYAQYSQATQRIISCNTYALPALLEDARSSYFSLFYQDVVNQLLQNNNGEMLLETLRVFIDSNAEINKTALTLNVHRNTLTYRLNQIKTLTGFNPSLFNQLTQLMIALYYHENQT